MGDIVNSKIKNIELSASSSLKNLVAKLKEEGKDIISLAIGEPDFDTPSRIKEAAFQSITEGFTHYVPTSGIPALKEAIAQKLLTENEIQVDPDSEVIVTPGAKFAIYAALTTFVEKGDEVLILEPAWISYKPLVQLAGGIPVSVPLNYEDNYKITREKIEQYITSRTKMIILNSPNNPTGRVITKDEHEVLVSIIAEKSILALSDEIYEDIIYDDRRNISLASDARVKEKIITVNGFSKGYAMTGWRLGYIVASKELVKEMLKIQGHVVSCATSFVQAAAVKAFECRDDVMFMVNEYSKRRNFLVPSLNSIPGFECRNPEGTFYAFTHVNYQGKKSEELCKYIFENTGVLVSPGKAYGKSGDNCVRISFAASMEELEKAVERLKGIFR